ncbi:hypothetical protein AGMMS50229_07910 [Campylobacterota bacterium]|nr:hypothetical protein AGMMS50229_07910 [Campylobacterota bacterium]
MNTIETEFSRYFRQAFLSWLIFAWLVSIVTLFALPTVQAWQNQQANNKILIENLQQFSDQKSALLNAQITAIGNTVLTLATEGSELLSRGGGDPNKLFYRDDIYMKSEHNKPFYLYAPVDMTNESKRRSQKMLLLTPILESSFRHIEADRAFVYIDDPVVLTTPPIQSVQEIDPSLVINAKSFYETFVNNPRKQWRFSNNQYLIAPVFNQTQLIGVAGLLVSRSLFEAAVSNLGSDRYGLVFDRENTKSVAGSMPPGFNINALLTNEPQEHFIVAETALENIPLSVVIIVPKTRLSEIIDEYLKLVWIAVAITIFTAAIALFIYLSTSGKIKLFSSKIAKGLDNVVRFSYHLGSQKADRLDLGGIVEIDDLNNHIHLAHSKIMAQLTTDDRLSLGNRRKLLEDVQGRGTYSIICIAVNHHSFSKPDIYYAAGDYVLEHTAKLIKPILEKDYQLYLIGNNRFAILVTSDDRDEVGIYAMKIVELIERGHYIFNETKLEISVRIGIGSEKTMVGIKLLSLAESDLIKPENS